MLRQSFQEDLTQLHSKLLYMGGRIEQMLKLALDALQTGDSEAVEQVEQIEVSIDKLTMEIDARAIELIAKQQPVAQDLRRIIGSMRIAIDLERVADISVNITEQAALLPRPLIKPLVDIPKMISIATSMFQDALSALINSDVELAKEVWKRDDIVDDLCTQIIDELRTMMEKNGAIVPGALPLLLVTVQIERIADHATNLAESVIYIATGKRI